MDRAQEVHTEPPGEAYPLADGAPAPGVEAGGVGGAVVVVEVDVVCCAKTPTAIVTVALTPEPKVAVSYPSDWP